MRYYSMIPARQLRSISSRYEGFRTNSPLFRKREAGPLWWQRMSGPFARSNREDDSSAAETRAARLEAVLVIAREPLSSRKLSQYANLADGTEARTLIRYLNETYDDNGRAFRVEEFAGGFQLLTRPKFAKWLRRLADVEPETRLSAPALETLAIVAYRQPVPRSEIEAIRGVSCGEMLRQLMERDFVRIDGRGDELGRPYLYGTTKYFLRLFGLRRLDDLPRAEMLSSVPVPLANERPADERSETLENDSDGLQNEKPQRGTSADEDPQHDPLEEEESEVSVLDEMVGQPEETESEIAAAARQSATESEQADSDNGVAGFNLDEEDDWDDDETDDDETDDDFGDEFDDDDLDVEEDPDDDDLIDEEWSEVDDDDLDDDDLDDDDLDDDDLDDDDLEDEELDDDDIGDDLDDDDLDDDDWEEEDDDDWEE